MLNAKRAVEVRQASGNGRLRKAPRLLLGYLRVSKGDDQSTALQRRALAQAGVERFFEDVASGGRWDRPQLHRLLDQLRAQDVVVVWKLDRLSRSLKDLLAILDRIDEKGAGFRSVTESVDTTVPAGRMMMQMVGAFAEFERSMIRERTRAGLAAARAEGRIGGRRRKLDPVQQADVVDNVLSGRRTAAQMARLYNVSQATVSRLIAANRQATSPA
ncbi:MAG: recombinase family protein [Alphaproteobacteria bacterium]|nr:recombinase family protein [Alphaproteobacteria bacterium]